MAKNSKLKGPVALGAKEFDDEHFILDFGNEEPDEKISYCDLVIAVPAPQVNGSTVNDYLLFMIASKEKESSASESSNVDAAYDKEVVTRRIQGLPPILQSYAILGLPDHLKLPRQDLHVIVSTRSGHCEADVFFKAIVQPVLLAVGLPDESYTIHHTNSQESVTELARETFGPRACAGATQTVLLLSGDGGIVDTINGLVDSSGRAQYVTPVLGLLALGTGNALANSSGLNQDVSRGLGCFIRGHPRVLPTFKATFSPGSVILTDEGRRTEALPMGNDCKGVLHGAVVASWGLHASLVGDSDTTEYRKFGEQRFSMAAQNLLAPSDGSNPHSYSGRVTTFKVNDTGQEFPAPWQRIKHSYLLATLVSNLEKTLTISPRSRPLDGQLRLLHFATLPSEEVMNIFGLAFDGGKHTSLETVGYDTIAGIRIDFDEPEDRWRRVCVDGKIVRVGKGGWVEVRKETSTIVDLVVSLGSNL